MPDTKLENTLKEMIVILENDNQIMNTFSVVADSEEFHRIREFVKENGDAFISLDVFWNLQLFHEKIVKNFDELINELEIYNIPDRHKIGGALKSFKTLTFDPLLETIDPVLHEAVKQLNAK